jgi:rubrerythrin
MRSFLIDCIRIETLASKTYQLLANNKAYAKEVCKVFQKLSDDEREHARHIDLVLQANEKDIEATPMISGEKISHGVNLAESVLQKVERERLSEEDALRLAVSLEQQFLKVHVNNAVHFHNLKLAELFNKLGSEDEAHLNTLKECLKWWHAERKQQLALN